jgi:peptidyl-prolyl cis-trans isomerase B (cyclophilin B)
MRLTLAIAAAVTVLGLSACGSDDAAEPATPAGSSAASASAAPSGEAAEQITFTTNYGPVVVRTDPAAEKTVVAQTALAEQGYFDGTICHRVVTEGIYVLQCGDPTGTGTGDPGYTLPDENLPAAEEGNYPAGTVAMANAGPNTGGSQFFIVYRDTTLPPGYTIWGEVTEGLDVVKKIGRENAKAGVTDGPPAEQVTIESATTG